MSVVKNLFGGSQKSSSVTQQQRLPPLNFALGTGQGTRINAKTTGNQSLIQTTLNPQIPSFRNNLRGRGFDLLNRISGNQSDFIDARVSPLIQRLVPALAAKRRSFANRGVSGSIAENEILASERDVARAIGEAQSLALNESVNAQRGVFGDIRSLINDQLAQDLALLGLESQAVQTIIASRQPSSASTESEEPNTGSGLGNVLFGLGTIFK